MSETTSSRLLTLLSLLQGRRDWPGRELADRLEVSARTVRRDVERLRALGYPGRVDDRSAGGYRLRAGTAMPPLLLDDDEAIAIAVGLRTAAGGVDHGDRGDRRCARWSSSSRCCPRTCAAACRRSGARRRRCRSTAGADRRPADPDDARRRRAATTSACASATRRATAPARSREAEPHSLVNAGRRWYLVAWDCGREDWRTFRVDRLDARRDRPARASRRASCRQGRRRARLAGRCGPTRRYEARLTLARARPRSSQARAAGSAALEPLGEDRCEFRTADDNLDWLAMRIAMISYPYTVEGPPELTARLRTIADGIASG